MENPLIESIDFAVYDHSEKHLLLVQVTLNKDKKLAVSTLEEFDPLFNISGVKIEQLAMWICVKLFGPNLKPQSYERMAKANLGQETIKTNFNLLQFCLG
jgi:hypothetical protein